MKGHILIADDEALYRQLLSSRLGRAGYHLSEAADGEAALECARNGGVDLALVDIKMPGIDGIEVLERLKQLDPQVEVVILTGHGNVDTAIAAMKLGAFDYLSKPYKLTELDIVVERALEKRMLARRCAALSAEVAHLRGSDDTAVIGGSAVWQRTLELVRKAAPLELPVLVTGESGAGKEIVAGLLHRWSARAAESYVPLNCGLLDGELVESELFGHKRGAFTSADSDKKGLFEIADGGTLFLDEMGEMPLSLQAKLLRVLQEGTIRPVGATAEKQVDVRIICATNRDLAAEVEKGRFRSDLYYRLMVFPIRLPPLRERREDIPVLAQHFLTQLSRQMEKPLAGFAPEVLRVFMSSEWRGNVRELEKTVKRMVVLADEGATLGLSLLPPEMREGSDLLPERPAGRALRSNVAQLERRMIAEALERVLKGQQDAAQAMRQLQALAEEIGPR